MRAVHLLPDTRIIRLSHRWAVSDDVCLELNPIRHPRVKPEGDEMKKGL